MTTRIEQILELLQKRVHQMPERPLLNAEFLRVWQTLRMTEQKPDIERWWQEPAAYTGEIHQALERLVDADPSGLDQLLFLAAAEGALPAKVESSPDPSTISVHIGQNQGGLVAGRDIQVSGLQNTFSDSSTAPQSVGATPLTKTPTTTTNADYSGEDDLRILFLAANPDDSVRLRLDREVRAIDHALRLVREGGRVRLEQQWAVQIGDLQDSIFRYRPAIVHFGGHGSARGLLLEDEAGRGQQLQASHLERLFSMFQKHLRCVVLNCCHSADQATAIAKSIDCVIGMSTTLADQAAIHFAVGFYRALAARRSVQAAFDHGCLEVDLFSPSLGKIPQLTCLRSDASSVFLHSVEVSDRGSWTGETR